MPLLPRLRSLVTRARSRPIDPDDPRRIRLEDVVIVVLNWNGRDVTLKCLESLAAADLGGARVTVVDNGSRDDSVEAIRARFPDVPVIALPENRGYAGGNNAGIRDALERGARAVLLLNNDTQVSPDFLEPLVWLLNEVPRAAAVASAIYRFDVPEVLTEAWLDVYYGFGIVRRRGVNALPGEGFDTVRPVDAGVGCSFLMRGEALRRLGPLDEDYFAYHEEVDWCTRARRAGWQIFYQPYSRVWHHISKSTDVPRAPARRRRPPSGEELPNPIPLQWNPVRTYLGARNSVRFMRRHGSLWQRLYFWGSTLYNIPLELLAIVSGREEELKLGLFGYRRGLASWCYDVAGVPQETWPGTSPTWTQRLRALLVAPIALTVALPLALRRAHRDGLTRQVAACVRGHWDGLLDRPLPLEQLGLR
jgi:GT2 family glycosyltransferase